MIHTQTEFSCCLNEAPQKQKSITECFLSFVIHVIAFLRCECVVSCHTRESARQTVHPAAVHQMARLVPNNLHVLTWTSFTPLRLRCTYIHCEAFEWEDLQRRITVIHKHGRLADPVYRAGSFTKIQIIPRRTLTLFSIFSASPAFKCS